MFATLVYARITRDEWLVVLVRQRKVLTMAARDWRAERRWSNLYEWLGGGAVLDV